MADIPAPKITSALQAFTNNTTSQMIGSQLDRFQFLLHKKWPPGERINKKNIATWHVQARSPDLINQSSSTTS